MAKREYTDAQRKNALKLYKEVGAGEAARQMKMPVTTLTTWARRAGLRTDAPTRTKAATEQAKLNNEQRRELIVTKLYERAERLLDRMTEKQVDYKGQLAVKVEFDETQPDAVNHLAKAIQALLDKAELLSGQATSRTETVSPDEFERYLKGAWDAYQQQDEKAQ